MKIDEKKANKLIQELEHAASNPELWDLVYHKFASIQALLSFPTGELMNKKIEGFILGWKLNNRIRLGSPITLSDNFNAQGLEGCVRVETDLINALLAYRELPRFRRGLATIQKIDKKK